MSAEFRYSVLSAGTWGVCLAMLLDSKGYQGSIWAHRTDTALKLERTRSHVKLPGRRIPKNIHITSDLGACLGQSNLVVCATPAAYLRDVCRQVMESGWSGKWYVVGSKGIELDRLLLPHQVALDELGKHFEDRIALLSGPSHAEEVVGQLPTAVTVSTPSLTHSRTLQKIFQTTHFRVVADTDMIGTGLAAALKNVVALACGISDGLGFGDNAKAAILTYGLKEISDLAKAMSGHPNTVYGLGGMGDLVVTCMSQHSRNWRCGFLIGQGLLPQQAIQEVGMVVEGAYSMYAADRLAQQHQIAMPLITMVKAIMDAETAPMPALLNLMHVMTKK